MSLEVTSSCLEKREGSGLCMGPNTSLGWPGQVEEDNLSGSPETPSKQAFLKKKLHKIINILDSLGHRKYMIITTVQCPH